MTGDPIAAHLSIANTDLSAELFPCANCHGEDGEPQSEGTLTAPGIAWSRLTAQTYRQNEIRSAYDEHLLERAIVEGVNASEKPLNSAMPRYRMSKTQVTAVIAYLKQLGSDIDVDPSISQTSLRLGSSLPLTGAEAATGRMLKATLEACLAHVNAAGGIYGRKLELVATDSANSVIGGRTELSPVFAYLASYRPDRSPPNGSRSNAPLIGPLAFESDGRVISDHPVIHLLPSLADQARALVDYLAASFEAPKPRLVVVHGGHDIERTVANAIRRAD